MTRGGLPLSLNEIDFCLTRAAVGAGAPFGIGEDFANACIWLACLGYDPAAIAAPALSDFAEGRSCGGLKLLRTNDGVRVSGRDTRMISALFAGPAAADQLAIESNRSTGYRLDLVETDHPILVLAAVGARELGKCRVSANWRNRAGGQVRAELYRGEAEIAGSENPGTPASGPSKIEFVRNGTEGTAEPSTRTSPVFLEEGRMRVVESGVDTDPVAWEQVRRYFRKCLMPSTMQSRESGAGAGDIDNT